MSIRKEKVIAYCAGIILLIVGVVCYAAFPGRQPEEPVRIMIKSTGGKVLFSHKVHLSDDDYGFDCTDCHHMWEEDSEERPVSCSECHMIESEEEGFPKRSDALHRQCIGCHEDGGSGPVECSSCHVL
jgi:hypothetical protein